MLQTVVPWLWHLFSRAAIARFMVDKVALGQVLLRIFRFSPVVIVPPMFILIISYGTRIVCTLITVMHPHGHPQHCYAPPWASSSLL